MQYHKLKNVKDIKVLKVEKEEEKEEKQPQLVTTERRRTIHWG